MHLLLGRFRYDKKTKQLIAEASDFGHVQWMCQIYSDAADIGINIESQETGRVEKFYLSLEEKVDDEIIAWHFKPVNKRLITVSQVTIFND